MKILMISSFPPQKCGIGSYSNQAVIKLRSEGNVVDVFTFNDGDGDYNNSLIGPRNILKLIKYIPFYEKIIIQYHDSFYYSSNRGSFYRIITHFSFIILFLFGRNIEIDCHEIVYPIDRNNKGILKFRDKLEQSIKKLKWLVTPLIIFHTKKELDEFKTKLKYHISTKKYKILHPYYYYIKQTDISKEDARLQLSIPNNQKVFLCIGFIQSHKGFDRPAKIFSEKIEEMDSKLYIVGSLRVEYEDTINYLNELKDIASTNKNIIVRDQFIDDITFDTWIIASDYIVIPYREIWSSGVLGRAKLFNKKCIVSNVGGLVDQIDENDIHFNSNQELKEILNSLW